jgi:hypothetical protein
VVPFLTTTTRLVSTKSKTLKHRAHLFVGDIVYRAGTKAILEVLGVLVVRVGLLGVNMAFGVGVWIDAQPTRLVRLEARGATVAGEVTLPKDLDELMFAVTLH